MAVTSNARLAERMRLMSLHGLSADAWGRFSTTGNWDYKIVAPGYKYNLTDIAAAIGIHQLGRAETMRRERESIALRYSEALAAVAEIELPPSADKRKNLDSWHLFAIKLRLKRLKINRDAFMTELKRAGVGCSVHWRPLHLHPYYQKTFGWRAKDFPIATAQWRRLISLPIYPGMHEGEIEHVINTVKSASRMRAEIIVKERSAGVAEARNGLPRWAEATFAMAGLVVAAPVIALTGLGIAVSSRRPVFFRQQRVGQHGDTFNLYKPRTMRPSAGGPQITSNVDSRITRLGKFLRNTKLDELPTLWNVLRGDMSLVGPRPEVPRFVQLADPTWQKVLAVRPGITDPVTLRLRSEAELLAQIEETRRSTTRKNCNLPS